MKNGLILLVLFFSYSLFANSNLPTKSLHVLESELLSSNVYNIHEISKEIANHIRKTPYNAYAHYLMSETYMRMFSYNPRNLMLLKQAHQLAQQTAELDQKNYYSILALAKISSLMGKTGESISALNELLSSKQNKSDWRIHHQLASINRSIDNSKATIFHFREALKNKRAPRQVLTGHINSFLSDKFSAEEAMKELIDFKKIYRSVLFDEYEAYLNLRMNNHQLALKQYRSVNANKDVRYQSLINEGLIYYQMNKRVDRAISLFKRALYKVPSSDKETKENILLHIALSYLHNGDGRKSKKILIEVAKNHVDNADLFKIIRQGYKNYPHQYISFLNGLKDEIGSALIYSELANTYAAVLKNYPASIEHYTNAITIDPNDNTTQGLLGLALYQVKSYPLAQKALENALNLNPDDAIAQYNLACVQNLLHKEKDAIASLGNAIKLDPSLKQDALIDKDLASLKALPEFKEMTSIKYVFKP